MSALETALTSTGLPFAQYGWSHAPTGDYGVWADDGANDLEADDRHTEHVIEGTIDYFTRDPSLTPKTAIESAIDGVVAWYLNSIQYEEDTGFIHYEWVYQRGAD